MRTLRRQEVDRVAIHEQICFNPGVISMYTGKNIDGFKYTLTTDEDKQKAPFAPVGEGVLDFEKIISTAMECGVKDFLVEQDVKYKPSLECAKSSCDTIKKILNGHEGYVT